MSSGEKTRDDAVFVALTDRYALVKVDGRGSFKVSTALKQFGDSVIQKKLPLVLVDMSACIGMDSTFMGVLAGMATRLKTQSAQITLVNCSPRTRGLLNTLGLDQLITSFETADTPVEYQAMILGRVPRAKLDDASQQDPGTLKTMLDAHENLVEVAPENMPQFKDVLVYLREEVSRKTGERPGSA